MSARPILFLDVDGVLNVPRPRLKSFPRHETEGGPVWIPEGTADRVARLLVEFDLVWATAWQGLADGVWRKLLALDGGPVDYVRYHDLKLPALIRHAAGRRWAWVDDDADWELQELGWECDRHVDGLIVNPNTQVGLTDGHVEALLDWAAERRAA